MNLFEKYFQGKLRPEEQQELAEKRQDPNFEAEFQSYQQAFRAIQQQGETALKARLQAKERQLSGHPTKHQTRQLARRILQIAAVLLVSLLTITLWNRTHSEKDYLSDYFTPAFNTTLPNLRGNSGQDIAPPLQAALNAYNQKDYTTAILHFQKIQADSLQDIVHFYQANAHLALANSAEAIPLLQKLITDDNYYRYQSHWYLALAYLDQGRVSLAKDLLEPLRGQTGSYQKKASQILSSLE
jgi:hypothetical protein